MTGLPSATTRISLLSLGRTTPIRHSSTNALATKSLAKLIVFPLTHDKSFLFFRYNQEQLLDNNSLLVKYETKAVGLATRAWTKLRESEKSYNKKIVHYATKFLERTPWTEDSLRSIPTKSSLLRQVRRIAESKEEGETKEGSSPEPVISIKSTNEIKHDNEVLVNIPVYYPSSIVTQETLNKEITTLATRGEAYHRRQMIFTGVGVPLSLPFALVPVIPNIPGFYLAYRFYCNFKAMLGSKHLTEMQQGGELAFKGDVQLDQIYEDSLYESSRSGKKGLLLNEGIIDKVVETYDIPEARAPLLKALRQERKQLEKKEIEGTQ